MARKYWPLAVMKPEGMIEEVTPEPKSSLYTMPRPAALNRKSCESKPAVVLTVALKVVKSVMVIAYRSTSAEEPSAPAMKFSEPTPVSWPNSSWGASPISVWVWAAAAERISEY